MRIVKIVLPILLTGMFLISCEKEYSFESGNTNLTSGTWQFQNNTIQYNGNMDSAVIQSFSNTKVLTLVGKSLNGQESFRILLYTTGNFTTTNYAASLSQCEFDYFTPSKTIFKGDFLAGEFVVSITALSNNTITGIFSGEAEDSTGAETQITLGTFTSSINLSTPVPTSDYFPTTINSNWTYGLSVAGTTDSLLAQVIPYAPSIGGNVYTSFTSEILPTSGFPDDTGYYRKSGNDYFSYSDLSVFFGFDAPVKGEYRFLNDALPAGSSFRSSDFNGTILTVPATGYIQVTIDEKAVSVTSGALNFPDVIKVIYEYYITALPGLVLATEERWYARGVGLIHDDINGTIILDIGRYTVL